jgi:signal transduction histidine kinase
VIDPNHLPFNKLPPPVHIEQVKADGKVCNLKPGLRLPSGVRDVWIDYNALSLVAPEQTRFRYKLEGQDRDWIEVVNNRVAQYSNLPPRRYRFRVMAANNSGVWIEACASLDFAIDPAYYQTTWFRYLVVAAVLGLLAVVYQLRQRQLVRRFNLRMEDRINERLRIARDLHDTLLQSFQGVLLKFGAVAYLLPDRPEEARATLASVVEQAREAITEGRDAVYSLRSSTVITNDLARAIGTFGEDLCAGEHLIEFQIHVEGKSRELPPIVRDEIYRIACEALRNAHRHAQARRIEAEIHYERRNFRLRIRDDGKGIDRKVLTMGSREGHYGLPGMQERAKLVGGKLVVWSELKSGTEIELTIPSAIAYAKAPPAGRPASAGQGNLMKG